MLLPVDCPNADRQECRTLVPITKPDLWQMFMILIYGETYKFVFQVKQFLQNMFVFKIDR